MLNTPAARIDSLPPLYGGGGGMTPGGNTPASTRDHQAPRIIVGNALAGDTIDVCDYLDAGDGAQIQAALVQAGLLNAGLGVDVHLRPGTYTLASGPLVVPYQVWLYGAGYSTVITPSTLDRRAVVLGGYSACIDMSIVYTAPVVGATGTALLTYGFGGVVKNLAIYAINYAQTLAVLTNESLRYCIFGTPNTNLSCLENIDITFKTNEAVGLAPSLIGIGDSGSATDDTPVYVTNCRVVNADIGIECLGNALITGSSVQAIRRRGFRLVARSGGSRHHSIQGCRVFMAGTANYAGIEIDTGTLAAGTRSTMIVGTELLAGPAPNAASTGVRLTGTGDGNIISATEINGFPLGLTVSALQANVSAKGVIRGATTPVTDASGSLLNEMRVI